MDLQENVYRTSKTTFITDVYLIVYHMMTTFQNPVSD